MAAERLPMRKLREIIRRKFQAGQSGRAIARACGLSPSTVGVGRIALAGLTCLGIEPALLLHICSGDQFGRTRPDHFGRTALASAGPAAISSAEPGPYQLVTCPGPSPSVAAHHER